MANKLLILFGNWLIQFLEIGTLKSFSVLFNHIVKDMDITTGTLGMYFGMYHAVTIMSGIFAKLLLDWVSPRSLSMLGGFIGSLGLVACSFAQTHILFAFCLFFAGLGFSMSIFPSLLSVIHAFGDRYLLPFSVGAMGAGVGMMLLPLLSQKLLEIYNWRGAMLILGAINLHVVATGALFDPRIMSAESPPQSDPDETQPRRDNIRTSDSTRQLYSRRNGADVERHIPSECHAPGFQCCCIALQLFRAAFRNAGFYAFKEHPILFYTVIASYLHGISYVGWTVFVIPNAEAKGFDAGTAIYLSFVGGIGNTFGRLMPGCLNFLKKDVFSSRVSFIIFGMVGALPLCFNRIASHFITLSIFATINGLALGAKTVVKNTSTVDVVPQSLSSSALVFAMISSSVGEITGGWITGQIYDITGSMDTAFLTLGCIDIIGAIVLMLSFIHEEILKVSGSTV